MCDTSGPRPGGRSPATQPSLFLGIPLADRAEFCGSARIQWFARGEALHIEGDSIEHVFSLCCGCVKMTQLGTGGREAILRMGVPGDVLGGIGLFSGGRHSTTARACRLSVALVWDASTFKHLFERYPVMHGNLVRNVCCQLTELEQRFREVATERVEPRVARQLARLLKQIGQPVGGAVRVDLTREELAHMTGTTLYTVSRLFMAWQARGMVTAHREAVSIHDLKSLRDACRNVPST